MSWHLKIKRRTAIRYVLFQIPSWTLLILILVWVDQWLDLPPWVLWGIIAVWLSKDAVMFFWVWRAYDRSHSEVHLLVGAEGVVEERLAPVGHIRVHGELWKAEVWAGGSPAEKGEIVRIEGIRGLTLLVLSKHLTDKIY